MYWLIKIPATVVPMVYLLRQCRKPSGAVGTLYARMMNVTHSALTDWGLAHVAVGADQVILDVGCGGGRTIQKLAALAPRGTIWGIDYSAASVRAARRTNADAIGAGRVRIEHGSVAALPFADGTFDLVTAVETHYYWPDLPASMREIFRVLKPGGTVAVIAETVRDGINPLYRAAMPLLGAAHLSTAAHRDLLTGAGFAEVATHRRSGANWICASGRRPEG